MLPEGVESRLARMETNLEYIVGFIATDRQKFEEHITESREYREKVLRMENLGRQLDDHIRQDFWIQGGIIGFLSTVVTAVIIKYFHLI